MAQNTKEELSLGQLFSELTDETRTLLRQEVRLAKVELSEKVTQAQHGITFIAIGGAMAFAGFLALIAAAIVGLTYVVELWLAALIVGVVVGIIGLAVIAKGREDLKAENLTLSKTSRTLQEDKKWAQAQMR